MGDRQASEQRGQPRSRTDASRVGVVQDVVRSPRNAWWNSSVVRAFTLLEALVEGGCDAERPPRNENVGGSILELAEAMRGYPNPPVSAWSPIGSDSALRPGPASVSATRVSLPSRVDTRRVERPDRNLRS